jgi:hypothetical protein
MIMSHFPSLSSARTISNPQWTANALARYSKKRRAELGLSVEQAAELAGMQLCQWAAMEDGWLPSERSMVRAIAETLCVHWADLNMMLLFARAAQEKIA